MHFVLVSNQKSWKNCITIKNCFLVKSIYIFSISKSYQAGLAAEVRRQCEEAITWTIYSNRENGVCTQIYSDACTCATWQEKIQETIAEIKMQADKLDIQLRKKKPNKEPKNMKAKLFYTWKNSLFPKAGVWCFGLMVHDYLVHENMLFK